jgi:trans-2,3-dihydro-3-hydroxyanthranilate isomerase
LATPNLSHRQHFVQADVFTDRPFGGNQLAVFTDARGLSGDDMQALTREMNFAESTFVLPPEIPGAVRRVRIFTPGRELPMAGHPTVGTAYVLVRRGEIALDGATTEATLQLGIGPVKVAVEHEAGQVKFVWMSHRDPEFGPVREDRERVAGALGISGADLLDGLPVQVVSTGLPFLYVPVRSLSAIGRCRPDLSALNELFAGTDPVMVYMFTTETVTPGAHLHCRMFGPHVAGIAEDPATGSAAGPMGAYAARYRVLPHGPRMQFVIEQGIEMGRASQIHVQVQTSEASGASEDGISGIRIGGQAVIVGEGEIFW